MTTTATIPAASPDDEELLTPTQVAKLFDVDPKTVTRWAKAGRLEHIRTLGGHRRYPKAKVLALRESLRQQASTPTTI